MSLKSQAGFALLSPPPLPPPQEEANPGDLVRPAPLRPREVSPPRHPSALGLLPRPRAGGWQRCPRRRGRGGPCPSRQPAGPVAGAARRQPRGAWDGGGGGGERPLPLEPTAHFQRVSRLRSPPAPRELQSGPRRPVAPLRSGAPQPGPGRLVAMTPARGSALSLALLLVALAAELAAGTVGVSSWCWWGW